MRKLLLFFSLLPKKLWFLWNLSAAYRDDVGVYNSARENNAQFIEGLSEKIGERTTTHADIHFLQSSQVIVVGRYGNRDFVKAYPVKDKDIRDIVRFLRNVETNSRVGRIDMPSTMSFSALYENDRF